MSKLKIEQTSQQVQPVSHRVHAVLPWFDHKSTSPCRYNLFFSNMDRFTLSEMGKLNW